MLIDIPNDLYNPYFESIEKFPVLMWQFEDCIYFEFESHLYIIPSLPHHSINCTCKATESSAIPN